MKINSDYEKNKSRKLPKNYENRDTSNNTNDYIESLVLEEKLFKLQNNLKNYNPNKNSQHLNFNLENNQNTISMFVNEENQNERINDNEVVNNSMKLMDIKLNHQMLQNKIENLRKTLQKETSDSNYNTISTSDYFDFNPKKSNINNFQNDINTPRSYINHIKYDHKIKSYNKENNINNNIFKKKDKEFSYKNNLRISNNFYNSNDQFNTIDFKSSERFRNTKKNIGLNRSQEQKEEYLIKETFGNSDFGRNSILSKFKINNNEMNLDDTKMDLADIDEKIQTTKKKLNEYFHRVETLKTDKKINKNINQDILNDNLMQYQKYRTLDAQRLIDNKGFLNDVEDFDHINRMRNSNPQEKNFTYANNYKNDYKTESTYKKDRIKNKHFYEEKSSR